MGGRVDNDLSGAKIMNVVFLCCSKACQENI